MKKISLFLAVILVLSLFSACTNRTKPSEPEIPEEPSASLPDNEDDTPPDSPLAELRTPGEIKVYIKNNSDIFDCINVPVSKEEVTLLDIVTITADKMGFKIPVKGITQQKGMVVVDIKASFLEDYSKQEIESLLTSVGVTLRQNHLSFEWIQYQVDSEVGSFGKEFELPPLKLLEGSKEEYKAIRKQIPYEGVDFDTLAAENPILPADETAKKFITFLSVFRSFSTEFASPKEIPPENFLEDAIFATAHYSSDSVYGDNYRPELEAFAAPASEILGIPEDWFWLEEHIEATAKQIYGENINYKNMSLGIFPYLETLGVYTPPHMGIGYNVLPVVFSYEDIGGGYRIEAAFIVEGMGGYIDVEADNLSSDNPFIPAEDLKEYVQTKSKHHEIILLKNGDSFTIQSNKIL